MFWKKVCASSSLLLATVSSVAIQQEPLVAESSRPQGEFFNLIESKTPLGNQWDIASPVGKPCYSKPDPSDPFLCSEVVIGNKVDRWLTRQAGGYFYSNWASCQAQGQSCAMPTSDGTIPSDATCHQGSVPQYMVKANSTGDIRYAMQTARWSQRPFVIKNTGHDWKGRSGAPDSVGVWTHGLQHPQHPIVLEEKFKPLGGDETHRVFHFAAGEQWNNAYEFAEKNNLAVLGGTCGTVGIAGWLGGGGHSPLTPVHGMGVDNVVQVEIMLPNGTIRIANEFTNKELFFAMRGGGSGAYGVITRIAYKALDKFAVQQFNATFYGLNDTAMSEYFGILTSNAISWSEKGWGGYIKSVVSKDKVAGQDVEIINSDSTFEFAQIDLEPLTSFLERHNINYTLKEQESWYSYFIDNLEPVDKHVGGSSGAVSSRLVPPTLFTDDTNRTKLDNIIMDLYKAKLNLWLMLVTPSRFNHTTKSSLHPSWKTAIWSIRINDKWDQFHDDTSIQRNWQRFKTVYEAMNPLRKLAPDMGVSINEADIWEDKHEDAFWGKNHERLKKLKDEVDPDNFFTNYMAVGWKKDDKRYQCYPKKD